MLEKPVAPMCTAFRGQKQFAAGNLAEVAIKLRTIAVNGNLPGVLVFDDETSQQIDIDLRGSSEDILQRIQVSYSGLESGLGLEAADGAKDDSPPKPGRPKLGVVSREVTLLPRHWEFLNKQPGGASVAIRKLVEDARRTSGEKNRVRQSQDAAYKFMSAIAGNEIGFEEAARALFAKDRVNFENSVESWPADIRKHLMKLSGLVF